PSTMRRSICLATFSCRRVLRTASNSGLRMPNTAGALTKGLLIRPLLSKNPPAARCQARLLLPFHGRSRSAPLLLLGSRGRCAACACRGPREATRGGRAVASRQATSPERAAGQHAELALDEVRQTAAVGAVGDAASRVTPSTRDGARRSR